ncbi:MAG TPA: haloacid dehalogenase type II [Alphaproteobacteria bacterium]|jgi:2-haloacid dehalogenase|nr:haloacid dehalogenase type II [Alphaproteobacteria bacterium]
MANPSLDGIGACVFDAYGTLFDVNAAAAACAGELGEQWQPLAETWRLKQLQYTWLRSLMRAHTDFWQVTGDALDFAMDSLGLDNQDLRTHLMDLYLTLDAYSEVPGVLARLRAAGMKCAILSNGSPNMLESAASHAGIAESFDAILSVEEIGIFKPDPAVYQLAVDRLEVGTDRIAFLSSNAWDAAGAAHFGFRVVWVNRFGQVRERIPDPPHAEITALDGLPDLLGIGA